MTADFLTTCTGSETSCYPLAVFVTPWLVHWETTGEGTLRVVLREDDRCVFLGLAKEDIGSRVAVFERCARAEQSSVQALARPVREEEDDAERRHEADARGHACGSAERSDTQNRGCNGKRRHPANWAVGIAVTDMRQNGIDVCVKGAVHVSKLARVHPRTLGGLA